MIHEIPNVAPGAVEPEPEAENTGADESGVQGQSQPDADGNSGITAASTEHHDDRHSVGGGNFETESSGEEPSDAGESGEQLEPAASNQPAREQEADANGTAARDETAKTADETTLGDCAPDDAGVASAEDAEAGAIASDQASDALSQWAAASAGIVVRSLVQFQPWLAKTVLNSRGSSLRYLATRPTVALSE